MQRASRLPRLVATLLQASRPTESLVAPLAQACSTTQSESPIHRFRLLHTSAPPCHAFSSRDYYAILELPKDASEDDVKKAYFRLAKKYHPDANKTDPKSQEKFHELRRAYDTLKDPEKRRMYDQVGRENMERMEQGGGAGPGPGAGGFGGGGPFGGGGFGGPFGGGFPGGQGARNVSPEEMEEIFEQFFGGGLFGGMGRRGGRLDMQTTLEISFLEAAKGASKSITFGGTRDMPERKTVDVRIPPGIQTGQTLQLKGAGLKNERSGRVGSLLIEVVVQDHPTFQREGGDILVDARIDVVTAILGGEVPVPTVEGDVLVKIKSGTQPNDRLLLRGRGIKAEGQMPGDQIITIKIELPKSVTDRQRQLLEEFKRIQEEEQAKKKSSWF